MLSKAKAKGQKYMKIPYHRVHEPQSTVWLNRNATIIDILEHAPVKGESQVAFHRTAKELFSLGNLFHQSKDNHH
jgi:hypothetical protein